MSAPVVTPLLHELDVAVPREAERVAQHVDR